MAEVAPAGGGPNRAFILIAAGLVGLLILGVIGVGAIWGIQQFSRGAATPTSVRLAVATPTRVVPTATAIPTETPAATPTLVFVAAPTVIVATAVATGIVTGTVLAGTGTPGTGLPQTGLGEDLLLLAAGIVLVLVIFAARRARTVNA